MESNNFNFKKITMKNLSIFLFLTLSCGILQSQSINSERIKELSDSVLANTNVPGMVVLIKCGDDELLFANGYSNLETKEQMTTEREYRIGSVTKTFVTTVFLQLVDEGLISLDETLDKFYPEFKNSDRITMRLLGNMKSGIYNYTEEQGFSDTLDLFPQKKWTPQDILQIALRNEPYFEPGEDFHYSNTNTALLGLIIEEITGNDLWSELDKRIFKPLGMKNIYSPNSTGFKGTHYEGYLEIDTIPEVPLDVTDLIDPSWAWAAGQLVSDIESMKVYIKALAEGKLTSTEMHSERFKDAYTLGKLKYGFGIFSNHGYLGHNGGIPGFTNFCVHNPETGCTVIIVYNIQSGKFLPEHFFSLLLNENLIPSN